MKFLISLALLGCCMCFSKSTIAQLKNPRNVEYQWETDTTNRIVDLSEITLAVTRNYFPTIDYPAFINKTEGLIAFFKHEPVISVEINGYAKAYPLNMLTMHEMSNDSLGGVPILPTYCPLCNSSVVYDRRLNYKGKNYLLDFEVSGMLRNSDMVMADKQTQTWWQQLMGKGLVGELADADLTVIPSLVISVEEFFNRYSEGLILSPETATSSEDRYGTNPYVNYDAKNNSPYKRYFDHAKIDQRLDAMERIIDIKGEDGYKIYPFSIIAKEGTLNDVYDDKALVFFHRSGTVSILDKSDISKSKAIGSVTVFSSEIDGKILTFKKVDEQFIDNETASIWDITGLCLKGKYKGMSLEPEIHGNHFAFAWLSFYPNSEIFSK